MVRREILALQLPRHGPLTTQHDFAVAKVRYAEYLPTQQRCDASAGAVVDALLAAHADQAAVGVGVALLGK